jgi:hypothetical protein
MAVTNTDVEKTFLKKMTLIKKNELDIIALKQAKSAALVPHQESIASVQADYANQIAAKQAAIDTLNDEIEALNP